jgi:hypothetical protein
VSADLERDIDRALTRLPAPRAPETLLPRVMQAVGSAEPKPSGWFTWPVLWQAASLAAMVIVLVAAARLWPLALDALTAGISISALELKSRVGIVAEVVAGAAGAIALIWSVLQPVIVAMVVLMTVMCGACALFGAALRNVVLGGASR